MNHCFKTVWNAVRRSLVVVNETKTSASQSRSSDTRKKGATASPLRVLTATAAAVMMSFGMASAASAAEDFTYNKNFDASGGKTTHQNLTISDGVTLTNNEKITILGEEFGGEGENLYTVTETLTNNGTVIGDGYWDVKALVNNSGKSFTAGHYNISGNADTAITNSGTMVLGELTGTGAIVNEAGASLTLNADYTVGAAFTNTGTLNLQGLTIGENGSFANNATSGVTLESLNVSGGNVTGSAGVMTVNGAIEVSSGNSVEQNQIVAKGNLTSAGTMDVDDIDLEGSVTYSNTGTATHVSVDGVNATVANNGTMTVTTLAVKDFDNLAGKTLNLNGTATVAAGATFDNAGTINGTSDGVLSVSGTLNNADGAQMNAKSMTVSNGGSSTNSGTLSVAQNVQVNNGGNFANVSGSATVATLSTAGTFSNAATFSGETFDVTGGTASNTGTINLSGALDVTGGTFTNSGAVLDAGATTVAGELANSAASGVTLDSLSVTGTGRVTGTGSMQAGAVTLAQGTSLAQNNLTATDAVNSDGTVNLSGKLTAQSTATFTANASGTISDAEVTGKLSNAGSMTFTKLANSSQIENTAGTLTIGTLSGSSALTISGGTVNVAGNAASINATSGTTHLSGAMTLTGNVVNTGTITAAENATLSAVDFSQSDSGSATLKNVTLSGALDLDAGSFTAANTTVATGDVASGVTVNVADLTAGTSFANAGTLASTGTADLTAFTQTAGTSSFNTVNFKGTGTASAGSITSTGTATFSGEFNGAGATLSANVLNVNENVTFDSVNATGLTTVATGKTLTMSGGSLADTTLNGTLNNSGTMTISSLAAASGAAIVNSGTLTLTAATNPLDHVTYTQNEGGSFTMTNTGNFFTNSTINLNAGTFNAANYGNTLGTGNVYTVGGNTSGNVGDVDWMNSRTVLTAATVTKDNTITLNAGGVLDVATIDLSGATGKTLNLAGGALVTTLDQIFEGVKTDAIDMEAVDENGRVEIKGSVIGLTTVGDIKSDITTGLDFGTGDIVFDDASITTDLVTEVMNRIDAVDSGEKAITVHFSGSADKVFTVSVANSVIDNNTDVSAIFDNTTLYSRDDASASDRDLVVGNAFTEGQSDTTHALLKDDIGFANVAQAQTITIQDGKEFALIGKDDGQYGSVFLNESSGGTVTVTGEGSQFTLGTLGRKNMTGLVGTVNLTDSGKFFAKAGDYKVTTVNATDGTFEVGGSNTTAVTTLALGASGVLNNAGILSVQTLTDVAGATSTNTNILTVTDATAINGTFTTESNSLTEFQNKLTVNGQVVNKANGEGKQLQVVGMDVTSDKGFINEGKFVSTGANNITGSSTDVNTVAENNAFYNKEGATATMTAGKTTIGSTVAATNKDGSPDSVVLFNQGTMQMGDVEVLEGGVLRNFGVREDGGGIKEGTGVMSIATLTLNGGSYLQNTGTLTVNTAALNGTVLNNGTMMGQNLEVQSLSNTKEGAVFGVTEQMTLAESFTNGKDATYYAADAETKLLSKARMSNSGLAVMSLLSLDEDSTYNNDETGESVVLDLNVESGATVDNAGTMSFNKGVVAGVFNNTGTTTIGETLEIQNGGQYNNSGSSAIAKEVTIADGGAFTNSGEGNFEALKLIINGGTFTQTGGTVKLGTLNSVEFNSGSMIFNGEGETPVNAAVNLTGKINGDLVVDNAVLTLGTDVSGAAEEEPEEDPEGPEVHVLADALSPTYSASTLIAETAPLSLGSNGKLAVGNGAQEQIASMTDGSAWFGSDSTFVIDTGKLTTIEEGGSAALVGTGSFTAEEGATLVVSNVGWGNYYVTNGFADENLAEGSWDINNAMNPDDPAKNLVVSQDEEGNVILTVGSSDITDKLPEVVSKDIWNEVITSPDLRDTNRKDVIGFISKSVEDSILAPENQAEVINSVSQIAAVGGLLPETMTLVGNVADITDRHLSFGDVHFKNGELASWDGVRFWADALGQRVDKGDVGYSNGSTSYDGTNAGFVFGADFIAGDGYRFGASFAAQKGDIETNSGLVKTSNDAEAYSLTAYAAKNWGNFNLIGSLGYTFASGELQQVLPSALELGTHTLDSDQNVITVGLRGEYRFAVNDVVSVVPYVGIRNYTFLSTDDSSRMGGADAFRYDIDTLNITEVPVGVSLQSYAQTQSGWQVRSNFDAAVIPAFGDTEADFTVSVNGLSAKDNLTGDVTSDVRGVFGLGLMAEKDAFSFGGNLGMSVSGADDTSVTFGLNARYRF